MLYWVVLFVLGEVLVSRLPMALIVFILFIYCGAVYKLGWFRGQSGSDLAIRGQSARERCIGGQSVRGRCIVEHSLIQKLLFVGALFFVFGAVCESYYLQKLKVCNIPGGSIVAFTGTVVEKQEKYENRYRIRASDINDRNISAYITIEGNDVLYPGLKVTGEGSVKEYNIASNPGQFDQKSYELSKGNVLFLEKVQITSVKKPVIGILGLLADVRESLAFQYERYLDEKDGSLAKAMVLGEKSELDQDIRALYQRNGIAHLIAISGLHIAMLGGTLYHMLRRLSGSFSLASAFGITFIILYGIMTGLSGATLRAMIMLILSMIADVLGRKYDALTAIAAALLIMLVINPGQLWQAGFMLSFGAVLGIACVYPAVNGCVMDVIEAAGMRTVADKAHDNVELELDKRNVGNANDNAKTMLDKRNVPGNAHDNPETMHGNGRKKSENTNGHKKGLCRYVLSKAWDGFLVSISVQMVILPVLLYYFYEIPVYSVFLNIIVVPVMSVLLLVLIMLAVAGALPFDVTVLGSVITRMMSCTAEGIFDVYEGLCRLTEMLPCHNLCFGRPHLIWMAAYYVILAFIVLLCHYSKKKLLLCAVLSLGLLFVSFIIPHRLVIAIFDVGQGDGIFIKTPDNNSILIDGGSSSRKNVGTYILKNGIKYHGSNRLDYMIITHSDSDHYSGALELLGGSDISVDNFVLPAIENPDASYHELEEAARNKGCRVWYIKAGDVLEAGEVTFKCLNPLNISYADKNSGSIVFWLQYRDFDMLLTGDMDSSIESRLLDNKELTDSLDSGNRMEVLKVAHHGSATASSENFLKRVRAFAALVSVGEHNRYGHPAPEVMDRLHRYCGNIYLTKDSGAVTIETDGKRYTIDTFLLPDG